MNKSKKIKLIISVLITIVVCIFSLGIDLEDIIIPDDAGYELHPEDDNYHMGEDYTSYSYSDEEFEYIDSETGEEFVKKAIEYKEYIEDGIDIWIDAGKTISGDDSYEIIDMEEVDSGGMGTIKLDYDSDKGIAWVVAGNYDENDPDKKITEWTLTINLYWYEKKNDDGTYMYDDDYKAKNIAHEIGHVYGLKDLEGIEDYYNLMYYKKNPFKSITEDDLLGMEVCTESFISDEWVPVATEDRCMNHIYTTRSGQEVVIEHKDAHTYSDSNDPTCNDCGYIRPVRVPIENIGMLFMVRIDGQTWVLNQYSDCYNLPRGGKLCWHEVTGSDNPYASDFPYAYCYNYNGIDYTFGDSNKNHERSFYNLRKQTKVSDNDKSYYLKYVFNRKWSNYWYPQYLKSETSKRGVFWAELEYDEIEGHYVVIKRALVNEGPDSLGITGTEVWSPSLHFPAYFSNAIYDPLNKHSDFISPYIEIVRNFLIDRYSEEVTFMLNWEGSDLDLTLVTPNGTVIDPELARSDPDIDYVETETYEFYRISEPEEGQWQAKVKAVDVDGEEPYTLEVFGKSPDIEFNVYTDKENYSYPEKVLVSADVIAIDYVAGAEVTGTVLTPDGSTADIVLYDDGLPLHGDETPDDGMYSNYFAKYSEDGEYTFDMLVENTEGFNVDSNEPVYPFTRIDTAKVAVTGIPEELPTEISLDFPDSIQYSDMLSGKAILASEGEPLEGKEVEFGCMLPIEVITTDENGISYSSLYKVEEASGESKNPICVNFYGDDCYLPGYSQKYIEIEKEDAELTYTGNTLTEIGSNTTLSCNVSQEDDGYPGDITLAGPAYFTLTTHEGFSETYTADVDSDGMATVDVELPVGLYSVVATIDSDCYIAEQSKEAVLAVYDSQGPHITGGGWFIPEGKEGKVNFNFELKYKKDSTLKGNLKVTDDNTGTNYKAIDFDYMVVVGSKAYLSGNIAIDGEGSYPFTAVIEDNGSPGNGSDRFSIDILAGGEHIVFDEIIGSGSIVVHK
jgi:hypothetical protein